MPIHHVHGCIRDRSVPGTANKDLVLSMDEYFSNIAKPLSWQTTVQLHALTNATCLFVGASLTDINMLRLLTHAKENSGRGAVFALLALEDFEKRVEDDLKAREAQACLKEYSEFACRAKLTLLKDLGVSVALVREFTDIPRWLDHFTKQAQA